MKRVLLSLAIAALAQVALAEPFVWPSEWTVAEPGEAVSGGTLRTYDISNPRTFNPFVSAESHASRDLLMLQGASLLLLPPDSDEWIPYAAESFEVSEDGTVVDLVLREGIKWSDGTPVTVQDYYFRYLAETDPDVGSNAYDSWFIGEEQIQMEITGERSMRFIFPVPDRTAFPVIGSHFPAPDHILGEIYREGGAEALKQAWGLDVDVSETVWTSPWVPTEFLPDERLIYTRNPYFGEWNVDEAGNPLPYLETYSFELVQDQDAALNLYLAGDIDLFAPRNLDDIGVINVAIQNGDIDATVIENASPVASSQFIVFNWNYASNPFKQELFRSADFRRAMSHLVPREAIVELVYGGAASPMWSNVYQVLEYWVNPDVPKFEYDPEAAAELLAGLGFSRRNSDGWLVNAEGQELGFRIITNAGNNQREQIMQLFADAARDIGVNVEAQTLDFNLLVEQLLSVGEDRPFEAILIGLTGGSRDWPFGVNVIPCGTNLHAWNQDPSGECLSPQETLATNLYFEGRQTLDTEAAREIGYEIQNVLASIQPLIFTVSPSAHYSWLNTVRGEHPAEFINDLVGSREAVLTYKVQ
ncbi:MAG TPA: ABC transporter substrate-binding protein [Trueperaceae bacterium]